MKLITTLIIALLLSIPSAMALEYTPVEVELSTPIGSDILPGGGLADTDISESLIFSKFIPFVINYAIGLAVALSVIALIIGGYQLMTAYGNTEKKDSAKKTITWAIIGLIIAITAYGIVAVFTSVKIS